MGIEEKRNTIILLRWVLIIALSYIVVFSPHSDPRMAAICVAAFLTSNLVLMRLPDAVVRHHAFDFVLVTVDITSITLALWLCGSTGPDFFFLFFFAVFLGALGEHPELTAVAAGLIGTAYLCLLDHGRWEPATLLRVPFLFTTALTYGFLATRAREASARAHAAEQVLSTMSEELRSPLGMIMRYSEVLRGERESNLTPQQREGIARINQEAVQVLEVIVRRLLHVVDADAPAPAEEALRTAV